MASAAADLLAWGVPPWIVLSNNPNLRMCEEAVRAVQTWVILDVIQAGGQAALRWRAILLAEWNLNEQHHRVVA